MHEVHTDKETVSLRWRHMWVVVSMGMYIDGVCVCVCVYVCVCVCVCVCECVYVCMYVSVCVCV